MQGDYQSSVTARINAYKCKHTEDYLICPPVLNAEGNVVAYLRPVTADYQRTIPQCVELISRWRVENPSLSTAVFTITHERTRNWLEKYVILNEDRLLFLLIDFHGQPLGHIGFAGFKYAEKAAEIDAVLRGEKGPIPGLMKYAVASLISWGKRELGLEKISLHVIEDNAHAIAFYERCGFVRGERIPLKKVELPDEVRWDIDNDGIAATAERCYLKMDYKGKDS